MSSEACTATTTGDQAVGSGGNAPTSITLGGRSTSMVPGSPMTSLMFSVGDLDWNGLSMLGLSAEAATPA